MKNRQASNGRITTYHYNAHRLEGVNYEDGIGITYNYNAHGQVESIYDESGKIAYEYGNMGEITKETRTYTLPFLYRPIAITTQFRYDSWGRIDTIIYPDNEEVYYHYDHGGQLREITSYDYIFGYFSYLQNVTYDKFGAKISQQYGNGITTSYTYNETTRRLTEICSDAGNSSRMAYTYDAVGNVTQVTSTYPWLPNQNFTENFSYNSADQLVKAYEHTINETDSAYNLQIEYGNWGKIMQYDLTQTDMLNNATSQISRSLTYPSHTNNVGNSQTPFAPTMQNGDEDVFFTFGINGSLRKREVQTPNPYNEYFLFNSQNNLKAYSDDVMSFAYYGYNASNTRTYKISLNNTNVWINGQPQALHMQLQSAMFYPNSYLNFDAFGNYTKHYYNGTERIASRLGDKNTFIAVDFNEGFESHRQQAEEQFRNDIQDLISESAQIDMPAMADALSLQGMGTPNDVFYYHINHLGNTAFVTDQNQTITQGFLYAPFGEITTEYNVNFGNNTIPKYSFNAKELDEETGMYYYEARYYKPPVFTSRDPMFEKYFWMTPYAYCANNPVKYVDPTGMIWEDAEGNKITDHSKIKVYIFYDPKSFSAQSKAMYEAAEQKYGKGSVALSDVTTMAEFAQDWGNMASQDIKEVNLNYHGNNQTIMLNSSNDQYITATGNGVTNKGTEDVKNVQDLPTPKGNISNAQLNINTCKSNNRTQYELKGSKQTLMEAFHNSFNFQTVRGTSAGVSYNRFTKMPEPQWFFQSWDYMGKKPISTPAQSLYTPNSVYYRGGHK